MSRTKKIVLACCGGGSGVLGAFAVLIFIFLGFGQTTDQMTSAEFDFIFWYLFIGPTAASALLYLIAKERLTL